MEGTMSIWCMCFNDIIDFSGCLALTALGRENLKNQRKICEEGGIQPVVRLIRSGKVSERVLHTAIKTLGVLCLGMFKEISSFYRLNNFTCTW